MIKIPKNAMKQVKVDAVYHIGETERKMHISTHITDEMRLKYLQTYMNIMFADNTYRPDLSDVAHSWALITMATDIDTEGATIDEIIYVVEHTDVLPAIYEVIPESRLTYLVLGADKTEAVYMERMKADPARKLDDLLTMLTGKLEVMLDKLGELDINPAETAEMIDKFKALLDSEHGSELIKVAAGK